jgi:hypothetical protein
MPSPFCGPMSSRGHRLCYAPAARSENGQPTALIWVSAFSAPALAARIVGRVAQGRSRSMEACGSVADGRCIHQGGVAGLGQHREYQ